MLLLAVALVFGRTLQHSFINFDDATYVYENPQVTSGLTLRGLAWAFTAVYSTNWHPLTWLSHMLDCQLYGLNPWGHHLSNVVLHGLTATLLFLILLRMTGAFWASAFVATLFAIHPLRVESVAWVAERKDVLSGLFFMLTLAAYLSYVGKRSSIIRYLAVILFYALGLMAKPMLVTVPCVLLLLDYWPLGRFGSKTERCRTTADPVPRRFLFPARLFIEKIPLFVLSAASCVVTVIAQREALEWIEAVPLQLRVANALVSYLAYVGKMLYPVDLAVFYPHPAQSLPLWQVAGALLLLVGSSVAVVVWGRRWRYLPVGWFWYLGMLVPVAGLLQVGSQAMADRYTYLPQIGLYILVAWTLAECSRRWPARSWLCAAVGLPTVLVLMYGAWHQTGYWRDSEAIWTHTLACTSANAYAHSNLGVALGQQGKANEAIRNLREAIRINPRYVKAYINLGVALAQQGKLQDAIRPMQQALQIDPQSALAHCNLGVIFDRLGNNQQAMAHFAQVLKINPQSVEAHTSLGVGLLREGKTEQAMAHFHEALQIDPRCAEAYNDQGGVWYQQKKFDDAIVCFQQAVEIAPQRADMRHNLATALLRQGRFPEALRQWREVLRLQPENLRVLSGTAWMLATWPDPSIRNGSEAVAMAQRALQICGGRDPSVLDALAAAHAETGRFGEAVETAQQALTLATHQHNNVLAEDIRERIRLYEMETPYRDPVQP